ncbi:MAG TPA: hypothetical protein VIM69_02615, partial [Opitutaceae bacterium]
MPLPTSVMNWVVRTSATLVFAVGALVVIAWHQHIPFVLQIRPGYVAMSCYAAVCFLFSAISLGLHDRRRPHWAALFALVPLLIGSAFIFEYTTGANLGIDLLFTSWEGPSPQRFPGRMAPSTACCFVLIGVSLILLGSKRTERWRELIVAGAASMVLALCTMAMVGYLTGLSKAYVWDNFSGMALHTAAAMTILSLGVFAQEIRRSSAHLLEWRWLQFAAGLTVIVVTFILGESLISQQHKQIGERTRLYAEFMKNRLQGLVAIRSSAMEQMVNRWSRVGVFSSDAWAEDTQQYLAEAQGFEAIARLNRDGKVLWGCELTGTGKLSNALPELGAVVSTWWQMLPKDDSAVLSPLVTLKSGRKGVWMVMPLRRSDTPDQYLAAAVPLSEVLQWLVAQFEVDHYGTSLNDVATNSKIEYVPTAARLYSVIDEHVPLQLWDRLFELEAMPTVAFADVEEDMLPMIVVFLGLALAAALIYAIRQAQLAQSQVKRQ